MTSESEAVMIVPYEWMPENVEEDEPMTIASKMIWFRGQRVFRVGLKNHALNPVFFLFAIDLNKMGMKVKDVKFGMQCSGLCPTKMKEMIREDMDDEGSLQLFTIKLYEEDLGNCTFSFRICIEGTADSYSYQLCDRRAKNQLWAALEGQLNLADVEFIVKDKTYPAHKAILAARSPVFADKFEKKQLVKDVPHQIRIDGVQPSTVLNFLHFIYTGEPIGTLANEELLKLAEYYQLTTLVNLCKLAAKKVNALKITNIMKHLNSNASEEMSSSKITPEKDTEILFDRTTPTFRCTSKLDENGQSKCVMQYQNEDIFIAYFTGERGVGDITNRPYVIRPVIHLSCINHRNFGLTVQDIYCELDGDNDWLKLESKYFKKNAELLHVAAESSSNPYVEDPLMVDFDIKTVCTIGNYYYEMMDDAWPTDLWLASTDLNLTDVEIFVGTVKVMEAHRIILSARSPVLNADLNKINSNATKSIVTFGEEFDVEIVKTFLNFLYTGSLKSTDGVHQLSKLATMYQVETLKNVCRVLNANSPDPEDLTDYLLQL